MAAATKPRARLWPFALFLGFAVAYDAFRIALFVMTQTGAVTTDRPLDPTAKAIVAWSELAIGLVGVAAIPGLAWSRPWGFWATAAVNAYALVFDAACAVGVQLSAAGGMVPPAILLLLLPVFRSRFFPPTRAVAPCGLPQKGI